MKILIIGNLGYIGPVLARHLRSVYPKAMLAGFDMGYFAGCLMDAQRFPETVLDVQHYGDVRNASVDLFRGVDAVVQLAAISNDPMGQAFEQVTEEVNASAAVTAARLAREAGAKAFVFASSCSVYGAGGDSAKTESAELNPLTAYARSKIRAEQELAALATPEFRVTCLRFATACGFSPRLRLDLVLNDFVASAITAGRISILSDGTPWRPLIHVKDMSRAIEWAISRPLAAGGPVLVVNTGSNTWNYQVRELADAVRNELGGIEVSVNAQAAPDRRSYRVDFSHYASLAPQHQPQETLASAIRDLADGLRGCRFADADFRRSNLIRLKVLSDLRAGGQLDANLNWIKS